MQDVLPRFLDDLVSHIDGPIASRLIPQPLIASLIPVRDGVEDAREGSQPYLNAIPTRL